MKINIKKTTLLAALNCAGVKDIRYYLNGVCLRVGSAKSASAVHLCSTDGNIAFIASLGLGEWEGEPPKGPFELIIPYDAVKAAIKSADKRVKELTLESLPDGRYMLGNIVFTAVDGKFPDIRHVIPEKIEPVTSPCQFNPDSLTRANDALRIYSGNKSAAWIVRHNANGAATMQAEDAFCLVMPMRESGMADAPLCNLPEFN